MFIYIFTAIHHFHLILPPLLSSPLASSQLNLGSPSVQMFTPIKNALENEMKIRCFPRLAQHFAQRSIELLLTDRFLQRERDPPKSLLEAWIAVKDYEEEQRRRATELWVAFISPSAARQVLLHLLILVFAHCSQVNLPGKVTKALKKNMQLPTMTLFRDAVKELVKTLDFDFMPNFAAW